MSPRPVGHDFAAERAQRRRMRTPSTPGLIAAIAATTVLASAGAALAQAAGDGPLATAGSTAGGVPTETAAPASNAAPSAPVTVKQTPGPDPVQPTADFRDLEAAADQGRRAPLLGDYHGEVGAMVGTNGLRGAYGRIVTHPTDNMVIDLRFSTLHQNGLPYDTVFGPAARYRTGPDALGADTLAPGVERAPH